MRLLVFLVVVVGLLACGQLPTAPSLAPEEEQQQVLSFTISLGNQGVVKFRGLALVAFSTSDTTVAGGGRTKMAALRTYKVLEVVILQRAWVHVFKTPNARWEEPVWTPDPVDGPAGGETVYRITGGSRRYAGYSFSDGGPTRRPTIWFFFSSR